MAKAAATGPGRDAKASSAGALTPPRSPRPHTLTACTQEVGWRRLPLRGKFTQLIRSRVKCSLRQTPDSEVSPPGSAVTESPRQWCRPAPSCSSSGTGFHCNNPGRCDATSDPGARPLDRAAQPHGVSTGPFHRSVTSVGRETPTAVHAAAGDRFYLFNPRTGD